MEFYFKLIFATAKVLFVLAVGVFGYWLCHTLNKPAVTPEAHITDKTVITEIKNIAEFAALEVDDEVFMAVDVTPSMCNDYPFMGSLIKGYFGSLGLGLGHLIGADKFACSQIASWQEWKATVHGKGKIKLGIKNLDAVNVQISDGNITVELPPLEILSAEPVGVPQVHNEKTGLFSPVKQQDVEKYQDEALKRLREAAQTEETLAKAKLHAQDVLGKLLQWRFGQKVEFR